MRYVVACDRCHRPHGGWDVLYQSEQDAIAAVSSDDDWTQTDDGEWICLDCSIEEAMLVEKVNCPYCGNECECDTVHNGLAYIQCGPYYCDECGASEIGIYDGQYTNRKLTADEERTGWYRPGSPAGPLTPTVGGKIVDHKTAKAAHEAGMLDPIPSEPIYADDDPFDDLF